MVPFMGRPLIHRQLDIFRSEGINDIIVIGGYKVSCLEVLNVPIVYNNRFAETNMVYTFFCAESVINQTEDLIISYGDIIFEAQVLKTLLSNDAPISIVIDRSWEDLWAARMDDPLLDAETLKLEDGNKIIELGKKTKDYADIQGQYIGLIKIAGNKVKEFFKAWHSMDRDILYDGKGIDSIYMTGFLQHLIDIGWDARAAFIDNGWLEVDTVEDLQCYEQMEANGQLKKIYSIQNEQ